MFAGAHSDSNFRLSLKIAARASAQSEILSGRVVGAVPYIQSGGKQADIPLGPCLVESIAGERVDVIWGASGQRSAVLSRHDLKAATSSGRLALLAAAL